MNDHRSGFAVFFFPQALEVLGEAIRPYLLDGPAGPHVLCHEIDTGGALIEMTIDGRGPDGRSVSLELMVPANMVRMIVSVHTDGSTFGFGPRGPVAEPALPAVGPTAMPAQAQPQAVPKPVEAPARPEGAPAETLTRTPPKP
ncbi:SPOR domain-containing protein [Vulcaniibacterium tengchongense]|uniref:Stringent starvation protein B n=1 Tax=Vulcaniibacterium tengchongense TaxID=1273429 RepID=A0A3N4VJ87_9GAMM|nr:hypothetical protein [Vulcaniibacterium tengchongense]RPE77107.1 hypothetical protein EDC50_2365 [Vulcaniibacterium tengchongense]